MRRMTVEDVRLSIGGVWLVVFVAIFVANVVGDRLGRRRRASGLDAGQLGTVQGGLLGLLGLLLAFSFATAAGRFADRQELTLQESNAIGTPICAPTCCPLRMPTPCARRSSRT